VEVFGEKISVKVNYSNIKNPELNLVDNIIDVCLPNKYKKNGNLENKKNEMDNIPKNQRIVNRRDIRKLNLFSKVISSYYTNKKSINKLEFNF